MWRIWVESIGVAKSSSSQTDSLVLGFLSVHRESARDANRLAGYESGFVREQEGNDARIVLGFAQPSHGYGALEGFGELATRVEISEERRIAGTR